MNFVDYFFSLYGNSLSDLSLFLVIAGLLFIGRNSWITYQISKARMAIPLSIGGWGTRGKSGTERIKAAVFNALGYSIISKTTGCEAMFMQSWRFGKLREMFLFRPYDKATIWEQTNVVRGADELHSQIFLWECMGLTPAFISILQKQWMRDDIATITNTYPDHEDLQGPAGYNIPEVMTHFIPKNSQLFTTEEQMLPILQEAANQNNTPCHHLGWLQAGLLSDDVLSRFPYEEHPFNIALVLALGASIGIDRDFALKEMADWVIPDLGVLKQYPPVKLYGRTLEFINGMSANERLGCLGNWERMNFANHDYTKQTDIWLTTVVNNRADRIARSRSFAKMLVEDLSADCHYLIGTNLKGMRGYIDESWQQMIDSKNIWSDGATPTEVLDNWQTMAQQMRIPTTLNIVKHRLLAMLTGIACPNPSAISETLLKDPDIVLSETTLDPEILKAVQSQLNKDLQSLHEFEHVKNQIANAATADHTAIEISIKTQYQLWFQRKLIFFDDEHICGDDLIKGICSFSPPGLINRIMGIQNIKGTGLDFVYRWQAWESCYNAGMKLLSKDRTTALAGLNDMSTFQEYGILCKEWMEHIISTVKHTKIAQNEQFQAELAIVEDRFQRTLQTQESVNITETTKLHRLIDFIELFADAGEAVKRRKTANRIYHDLVNQRISQERAVIELKQLNRDQKNSGWLRKRLLPD